MGGWEPPTPDLEQRAINVIRGLAMDAPHAARSGHQGTAMALAPLAHVLWTRVLRYDAGDPTGPTATGSCCRRATRRSSCTRCSTSPATDLSLDDLRAFRQWGSATPGHPERTTPPASRSPPGPLGQGFANAVGMALAERWLRRASAPTWSTTAPFYRDGRRRPLGGRQPRGRLPGRPPRPRPARVRLRRQPHHHRRSHRAALSDDAAARFEAYGWHVERPGRGRRGPRRARGGAASGQADEEDRRR